MTRGSKISWINWSPERNYFFLRVLPLLFGALLVQDCAHRAPPPGGPVDQTSPEVVDHLPKPDVTNVLLDQEITITFSEAMDRASVADALFISPAPREAPQIKWKGRTAKLTLAEGLQRDMTYVITLGVGCKDLRKNNLNESYSFAFSTGERVEQGSFMGSVYQDISPRMGVSLWAYRLSGDLQPDPVLQPPDYITQTDGHGRFRLDHLGQGQYRLFAIEDLNGDRKFDADVEPLAVPSGDLLISEATLSVQASPLRLALLDTIGPSLKSVEAPDRGKVILYFDEPLDSAAAIDQGCYGLSSSGDRSVSLEMMAVSLKPGSSGQVILSTAPQEEGRQYRISLWGLKDLAGNQVAPPGDQGEFLGSGLPDTTGPELVDFWPPDSAEGIPLEAVVSLGFGEAVERVSVETSFVVLDSVHEPLAGQIRWAHGSRMTFLLDEPLESKSIYNISLNAAGVKDLAGNFMGETVLMSWFQTVEVERLGSLSGEVIRQGVPDSGVVFVRARRLDETSKESLVVTQTGEYRFSELLPGRYLLNAFLDLDGNGKFGFGRPIPFVPAEPFWVSQDTVRVRSRWETAGVDILLKR